ncbi:MAG: adenosylcobinamide-phosphate synthase CbiB [Oliverpabstia sp.]
MIWTLPAVVCGFLLDLLFGDPRWLYHPVRVIGNGISVLEKGLRKIFPKNKAGERIGGTILVILIVTFSAGIPCLILMAAYQYNNWLGFALESFMCYQLLATRSLRDESKKVYDALKEGNLEKSRYAVSMIVGRDTQNLTEEGVTKAAVETVAENTSDGIIAPLFYMMIGGAVLGFAYKAVNTMDSMVGYKNDRYQYFGTAAARLDDVLNYIPARLSAWIMIFSACLAGLNGKNAAKIYRRDRSKHASPNSAHTEAVMAGALEIQLAGDAWYFGKLHKKPYIGDPIRKIEIEDIPRSHKLMYTTAVLSVILFGIIRAVISLVVL